MAKDIVLDWCSIVGILHKGLAIRPPKKTKQLFLTLLSWHYGKPVTEEFAIKVFEHLEALQKFRKKGA